MPVCVHCYNLKLLKQPSKFEVDIAIVKVSKNLWRNCFSQLTLLIDLGVCNALQYVFAQIQVITSVDLLGITNGLLSKEFKLDTTKSLEVRVLYQS